MDISHLLGLLVPIMTAVFSASFFAFWLKRRQNTSLAAISTAFALLTIGFIVTQYLVSKASLWNVPLTNLFFLTGVSLIIAAACLRRRAPVPKLALGLVAAIGIGLTIAIDLSPLGINLRILANNYTLGALFIVGAISLAKASKPTGIDHILFWVFALIAAQLIAMSTLTLAFQTGLTADTYYGSVYWLVMNIGVVFSLLTLAFVFMAGAMLDYAADVKHEAETDLLTGLRTRRAFERDVEHLLSDAKTPTGIILFDLDHFKAVNDIHGHTAGDAVLKAVGNMVASMARTVDIAGRVGGEEFCIVLKDTALPATRMFAESLRQSVTLLEIGALPSDYALSASFGIAIHEPGNSFVQTYKNADKALYQSKGSGRNKVSLAFKEVA